MATCDQLDLEMGRNSEGCVRTSPLPPLESVHPNLQRVLQRTLSRKRGEARRPWEPPPGQASQRHSLLLLRPLAQSQPTLSNYGKGTVPGSHYPLQRTLGTNSINRHLQARGEGSASKVPSNKYLEQVCRLLDKIADLQERNSLLKEDKLQMEEKLRQKEKQLELLQHYCSCGSAAVFLQWAGQPGHGETQLLAHSFNAQCELPDSLQPPAHKQHSSLQKRWASDSGTLWPGNGSSEFPLTEFDSCHSESKEHLTSSVHHGMQMHNTAKDTTTPQAGWGRMREILNRLKDTSRTKRTFVTRFKGSRDQKHRQKHQEI